MLTFKDVFFFFFCTSRPIDRIGAGTALTPIRYACAFSGSFSSVSFYLFFLFRTESIRQCFWQSRKPALEERHDTLAPEQWKDGQVGPPKALSFILTFSNESKVLFNRINSVFGETFYPSPLEFSDLARRWFIFCNSSCADNYEGESDKNPKNVNPPLSFSRAISRKQWSTCIVLNL